MREYDEIIEKCIIRHPENIYSIRKEDYDRVKSEIRGS